MPTSNNLITEREAARLLGVSVALLRKQRYLGTGCPYVKINRLVRYRIEDIDSYVSASPNARGWGLGARDSGGVASRTRYRPPFSAVPKTYRRGGFLSCSKWVVARRRR